MPRPRRARNAASDKQVEALRHRQDTRTNIPTAEYQSLVPEDTESPLRLAYARRNRDLDPQLVWRGKDEQDLGDLEVNAPTLYIQEKVRPKALIDDLLRQSRSGGQPSEYQVDMFADFNGLPDGADRTEFYRHDGYWQNRMILGDALQVMASLAERESLQGKVQCIYIDPPYGIRFNSNFQWSTTSRDVRRRQPPAHHPRTRTGQSLPRHLARRHPLLPHLPARPPSPSPATCWPNPAPSSCRLATRTSTASGH